MIVGLFSEDRVRGLGVSLETSRRINIKADHRGAIRRLFMERLAVPTGHPPLSLKLHDIFSLRNCY